METTISKHMERPWELKWQSFANIFIAKIERSLIQQSDPSQKNGDDILTISSPSVVSFAAVISVVKQCSSPTSWGGTLRDDPNNGCEGDYSL